MSFALFKIPSGDFILAKTPVEVYNKFIETIRETPV